MNIQPLTARAIAQTGVTLIELLIALTIVAIISGFAYPSYVRYVVDTKRTAATTMLLRVADRQQQFFMDNKTYAADLTDLGFPSNPYAISDHGTASDATSYESVYSISLSNVATTTYTITAAPLHSQLARDTDCASLTLSQAGVRGSSGGGNDCWK